MWRELRVSTFLLFELFAKHYVSEHILRYDLFRRETTEAKDKTDCRSIKASSTEIFQMQMFFSNKMHVG